MFAYNWSLGQYASNEACIICVWVIAIETSRYKALTVPLYIIENYHQNIWIIKSEVNLSFSYWEECFWMMTKKHSIGIRWRIYRIDLHEILIRVEESDLMKCENKFDDYLFCGLLRNEQKYVLRNLEFCWVKMKLKFLKWELVCSNLRRSGILVLCNRFSLPSFTLIIFSVCLQKTCSSSEVYRARIFFRRFLEGELV